MSANAASKASLYDHIAGHDHPTSPPSPTTKHGTSKYTRLDADTTSTVYATAGGPSKHSLRRRAGVHIGRVASRPRVGRGSHLAPKNEVGSNETRSPLARSRRTWPCATGPPPRDIRMPHHDARAHAFLEIYITPSTSLARINISPGSATVGCMIPMRRLQAVHKQFRRTMYA